MSDLTRFQLTVGILSAALFVALCLRLWLLRRKSAAPLRADIDVVAVLSPEYLDATNRWPGHLIAMLPAVFAQIPVRLVKTGTWHATYRSDGLPDIDSPVQILSDGDLPVAHIGEDADDPRGRCRAVLELPRTLLDRLPPPPDGYPSAPAFLTITAKISAISP